MINLNELLEKAKWDKLSDGEISEVVRRIKETKPGQDEDLYMLLHILGRSGADQYRPLVEKFLYYPSYPMVSSIALKTLCVYWGYEEEYLDKIKIFIKGVDWDGDEDVKLNAVNCAGSYLISTPEKELYELLIHIFENDPNETCREAALESIERGIGREWSDILAPKNAEDIELILEKDRQLANSAISNERKY